MDLLLLVIYGCMFIGNIFLLVRAVKPYHKGRLPWVYLSQLASLAVALLVMWMADHAPGYGPMPGLTYFQEFFYSFFAAVAFAVLLLVSLVVGIFAADRHAGK